MEEKIETLSKKKVSSSDGTKKKEERLQIKPALLKSSVQGMNKRSLHIYVRTRVCTGVYTHIFL